MTMNREWAWCHIHGAGFDPEENACPDCESDWEVGIMEDDPRHPDYEGDDA